MARTKLSRGKEPFQMRSGNSTPYPFLGGVGKALGKVGKALTGGIGRKIMGQKSGAEMQEQDNQQMLAEMHAAIVGDEGDTMMTKKTHMYHKPHHTDKQVDPNTGKNHYHAARYTGELEGRKPE